MAKTSSKISLRRKLLFSIACTIGFFLIVEVVLGLWGVQPTLYNEDPYVGFSSYIPLFVEQADSDGNIFLETAANKRQWFHHQRFTRNKQADTRRVFCLGGSTTHGWPYGEMVSFSGYLRELLALAKPTHRWEVINVGGIGYASYRVAALMEELIRYEPDVFIIYCGHNEFLERRTYQDIIQTPGAVIRLGALLGKTRLHAVLHQLLSSGDLSDRHGNSARPVLGGEVENILQDATIGPESYTRDDIQREQVIAHYQFNVERMIDIARSVDAKVILVTPQCNLRDFSPFQSEHISGLPAGKAATFASLFQQANQSHAKGRLQDALLAVNHALEIDGRHGDLHFLRGRIYLEMGDLQHAQVALQQALEEDVCAMRILPAMQKIVGQIAAKRNVPNLKFDRLVEQHSEGGIAGAELFVDHVHPTLAGYRLLALNLFDFLRQHQIVVVSDAVASGAVREVTNKIDSRVDRQALGTALRNLSGMLSWAGKQAESERVLQQAATLLGEDAEIYRIRGIEATGRGDIQAAIGFYRQALQVNPSFPEALNNLGVALLNQDAVDEATGLLRKAISVRPGYARAHDNLGRALQRQGNMDVAIKHYEKAIELNLQGAPVHIRLARAYASRGNPEQAIRHFRIAMEIEPSQLETRFSLGTALIDARDDGEALSVFQGIINDHPDMSAALNAAAWLLATGSTSTPGDIGKAMGFAVKAAELTQFQNPVVLDTLATVYAAVGRFEDAASTAHEALRLAKEAHADELASRIRHRLEMFRQSKPFVRNVD